jgi:hypothetical protein
MKKKEKSGFDFLTSDYNLQCVFSSLFCLKWKIALLRYRHAGGISYNIGKNVSEIDPHTSNKAVRLKV